MSDEFEELTEEELAKLLIPAPPVYYAYFNDTGEIDAITNEKRIDSNFSVAEFDYQSAEMFLTGKANIINYRVTMSAKNSYIFVKKQDDADIGLNSLCFIKDSFTATPSCIVEWDKKSSNWVLYLNDDTIQLQKLSANLMFYITLHNKNFLVRSIKVDVKDMVEQGKIVIPFMYDVEHDIAKLTVSTRKFFDSYGLKVNE